MPKEGEKVQITYRDGDATRPIEPGPKVIVHICNNRGYWGKGFVLAVSKRWPEPEKAYRALNDFTLGDVQFIKVEPDIWVANVIGQNGIGKLGAKPPIRYDAVYDGLSVVAKFCLENNAQVVGPRFGAGLAGGDFGIIEKIINQCLISKGVPVTIYDWK